MRTRIREVIPFSAERRTSGVTLTDGSTILKGAIDAITAGLAGAAPPELTAISDEIAGAGRDTPGHPLRTAVRWASSSSRTPSSRA